MKVLKQEKMTKTSYLIGLLFGLSAIIYFFAANWGGMDRYLKILLIVLLMLLFYGISYGFSKWKQHQQDVGAWIFWGGSIAFGVAVALLGQVYNSHADSYSLFLIWLIPSILLAVFTRFSIFFVQSYILLNITVYTYFYPLNSWFDRSDMEHTLVLLGIIFLNIASLYGFSNKSPKIISYLSSAWIQFLSIELAIRWTSIYLFNGDEVFSYAGVVAYLAIILSSGWLLYDYMNNKQNKVVTVILSLGISINLIAQFLMVSLWINGSLVYIFGLLIAITLIILGTKWLAKLTASNTDDEHSFLQTLIKLVFVFLAVLLLSFSVIGLLLLLGMGESITWVMLSMVILVPIGSHVARENSILRYTMMISGGIISSVILWDHSIVVLFIYLILIGYTTWRERDGIIYPLGLGGVIYVMALILNKLVPGLSGEWDVLVLIAVTAGLYIWLKNPYTKGWNLVAILTLGLILTFFSEHNFLYYLYNFSYLIFLVYFTYRVVHKKDHWLEYAAILYLIGYLGYKYYDLFWTLLHKSITFAVAGVVFLGIAIYLDKKAENYRNVGRFNFVLKDVRKWIPIVLVQLIILSVIIFQKETILRNGTEIVLKVEPVDPRSILQGDYVQLSYNISQIDSDEYNNRVYVMVEKDVHGIYQIKEIYDNIEEARDGALEDHQVIVTGKANGNTITYGIENFFIEEGTGLEVEQNAKYAKIKVGSNGDAILVSVSPNLPELE